MKACSLQQTHTIHAGFQIVTIIVFNYLQLIKINRQSKKKIFNLKNYRAYSENTSVCCRAHHILHKVEITRHSAHLHNSVSWAPLAVRHMTNIKPYVASHKRNQIKHRKTYHYFKAHRKHRGWTLANESSNREESEPLGKTSELWVLIRSRAREGCTLATSLGGTVQAKRSAHRPASWYSPISSVRRAVAAGVDALEARSSWGFRSSPDGPAKSNTWHCLPEAPLPTFARSFSHMLIHSLALCPSPRSLFSVHRPNLSHTTH